MRKGKILKAYGGYFFVYDFKSEQVYRSGVRGRLRKDDIEIIAGDVVSFKVLEDGSGIIEARSARKNKLFRPPVANVEQVLIVFAAVQPKIDLKLLDRMLLLADNLNLDKTICINKMDLASDDIKDTLQPYHQAGYNVLYVSALENSGINEVEKILSDKVSVLAGPSGVGKSSILNAIESDLELKTGELSKKINRGRHTTRHVELLSIADGWVADTPGFSSLHLKDIASNQLQYLFPEMAEYIGNCRFAPCSHSHEPSCAVKEAKERGEIAESRYQSYLNFRKEIIKREEIEHRRG